jgi:hypothetical protein
MKPLLREIVDETLRHEQHTEPWHLLKPYFSRTGNPEKEIELWAREEMMYPTFKYKTGTKELGAVEFHASR